MKTLFTVPCKSAFPANKERLILGVETGSPYNYTYYDICGNTIPAEPGFEFFDTSCKEDDDPWDSEWIKNEGLEEKLIAESVKEIEWEIGHDGFGLFGFKNRTGEFVIEPQYAYAHNFTCGLAAVNLNRTWYRTKGGLRFYENHYGFINERGQTVIPFAYDEAQPFNKYGVAVVSDFKRCYLLNTEGNVVPGTEGMLFSDYYDYDSRYLEFQYPGNGLEEKNINGIYDTKERRILLAPSIESFTENSEDEICVEKWTGKDKSGHPEYSRYFIDSNGELLYPWLAGKGFELMFHTSTPMLWIVNKNKTEVHGAERRREPRFGVYSSKEKYVIPAEYEKVFELSNMIFCCLRGGEATIIQIEDQDL
ncbi:MAG: WG repeat-containing protein [Oscillospiraceae bacterium]|nr:WG repeat-containing protein [Oscillospiraceae bacterium]